AHDRRVRRGLHRVRDGPRLPGHDRRRQAGTEGGRPAYVLEGHEPRRPARGLRRGRRRRDRAHEPHPPAVQRELARAGRCARRPRGRRARARVRPDDRGGPALPLRRVQVDRALVRALAGQLHPGRRRPQRRRHLPEAPPQGCDRPADDPLRARDRAADHRRNARREPQAREGFARRPGEDARVIRQLAIVGVARLGGSLAKAARLGGLARRIVGIGRDAGRLRPALDDGTLDLAVTDLEGGVREADFILLATPVLTIEGLLERVWRAAPDGALITDVGSTKRNIVRAAERLAATRSLRFVGSHPLAGSEQAGYSVARADLFRGATVVVTPTEATELGALELAARGFRDTTRIAAGDPDMWTEIFLANRDALSATVEAFREALADLQRAIDAGQADALRAVLARIKATREQVR